MKKYIKIIIWILIISWMVLIFYLSNQPREESRSLSKEISMGIKKTLERLAPNILLKLPRPRNIVRKSAHFFLFFILIILILKGLESLGIKGYKAVLIGAFISIIFAISDEVHQLFVPGRGGEIKDVLIDSVGVITGILVYKGYYLFKK